MIGYIEGGRWAQERAIFDVEGIAPTVVCGDHGQLRIKIAVRKRDAGS